MYDLNDAQPQMAPGRRAHPRRHLRPGRADHPSRRARTARTPGRRRPAQGLECQRRQAARLRVHRGRGPLRPAEVLAELHRRRRQGRREGPVEGLEHLQERVPRDDRQRARAEPEGRERGGQAKAADPGSEGAGRHRFAARIRVEPGAIRNTRRRRVRQRGDPDEPQYVAVMRGETVRPSRERPTAQGRDRRHRPGLGEPSAAASPSPWTEPGAAAVRPTRRRRARALGAPAPSARPGGSRAIGP